MGKIGLMEGYVVTQACDIAVSQNVNSGIAVIYPRGSLLSVLQPARDDFGRIYSVGLP